MSGMSRVSRSPTLMPSGATRTSPPNRSPLLTAISAAIQPPSDEPITITSRRFRSVSRPRQKYTSSPTLSTLLASDDCLEPVCDGAPNRPSAARRAMDRDGGSRPSSPWSQRIGRPWPRSRISSVTPCTLNQPGRSAVIVDRDYIRKVLRPLLDAAGAGRGAAAGGVRGLQAQVEGRSLHHHEPRANHDRNETRGTEPRLDRTPDSDLAGATKLCVGGLGGRSRTWGRRCRQ